MNTAGAHAHEYRPDIDGLRAIAVLAVIGFHAFPRAVGGGFVGVDVFFVISGYLIAGILFRQTDRGRLDLVDFYTRRIRRIFPALTIMLIGVGVLGWFALTNDDFRSLEKHIAGGAFFVSNLVLWDEAGYFDAPSRFKPLLHLWSLGIEEQFYLLWPPVVYVCWKRGWNIGRIAAAIVVLSFALSVGLARSHRDAGFYLPLTRMWELLLGALMAYWQGIRREPIKPMAPVAANVTAVAGLVLIAVSAFVLSQRMPFPGWRALVPVAGTLLVIWTGTSSWISRVVLSWRPIVYIGLISYPLYLWHWPLLSFLQITEGGAPGTALKTQAIAVSCALAALTYQLIERPIRTHASRATPRRMAAIAASLLIVGGVSLAARSTNLFTSRVPLLYGGIYSRVASPRHDAACERRFPSGGEYCQVYDASLPVTTALVGDSHSEHFLPGVGARLAAKRETAVNLGQSGCAPLLDLERYYMEGNDTCRTVTNSVINYVANEPSLRRVVLSFRGTIANGRELEDVIVVLKGTQFSNVESVRRSLETTVDLFAKREKEIWLLLPVPELRFDLPECFKRPFSFSGHIRTPCAVPRPAVDARQRKFRDIVAEVQQRVPALRVFDPLPFLCDQVWCHAIVNQELVYADDQHLSREGSLFFADKLPF